MPVEPDNADQKEFWMSLPPILRPDGFIEEEMTDSEKRGYRWELEQQQGSRLESLFKRNSHPADEAISHEQRDWTTNAWYRRGAIPEIRTDDQE